jgi:methylated-DNA-[protein]-cysteine S-methyltransferase
MLTMRSPLGALRLFARADEVVGVYLPTQPAPDAPERSTPVLALAAEQLTEYFAGRRTAFALPLAPAGTAFQQLVWRQLTTIPFGETWSYGALARGIHRPSASRAVGLANSKNPISIIVPCHRVVGANGQLTGYAGGMVAKQWLLEHEQRHANGRRPGCGAVDAC